MGPLAGTRIVELAGIGPAPFAAMLLADMGAEVIRIVRRGHPPPFDFIDPSREVFSRGKRLLTLDLKQSDELAAALELIVCADALIEGFRPGVTERLGLGPETCLARNPRLLYGRMTGWGQTGPLAPTAGHDINYIALSGALHAIGPADAPPPPPLNLVGDFGGGGMLLAFGLVCGLLETRRSGQGQVLDAAMIDGAALQMAMIYGLQATGGWQNHRESNILDGAAPFYRCYRCADGRYLAVGAIEPAFYRLLLERCGIDDPAFDAQWDRSRWPELCRRLAAVFATRDRDDWCARLTDSDACVTPVLDLDEALRYPHNAERATFVEAFGVTQPAPAPRFGRTPARAPAPPTPCEATTLADWGLETATIEALRARGALG
ncbi:MAG: CaiB/BaiF CoA-transferase family protein [Candidatus Competibacterales bacterium]|nr:CaiB/BaiF CoA-transferase family protein [Candidatus Competibacterales bacterium]